MSMPALQIEWTADMVRDLPDDGNRYEVVDGELLVTPAPNLIHQLIVGQLHVMLALWLETHRIGVVFFSPSDIEFSRTRRVQPDVFVVPNGGMDRKGRGWGVESLMLSIEVLSPSTALYDKTKETAYVSIAGRAGILDSGFQLTRV